MKLNSPKKKNKTPQKKKKTPRYSRNDAGDIWEK